MQIHAAGTQGQLQHRGLSLIPHNRLFRVLIAFYLTANYIQKQLVALNLLNNCL